MRALSPARSAARRKRAGVNLLSSSGRPVVMDSADRGVPKILVSATRHPASASWASADNSEGCSSQASPFACAAAESSTSSGGTVPAAVSETASVTCSERIPASATGAVFPTVRDTVSASSSDTAGPAPVGSVAGGSDLFVFVFVFVAAVAIFGPFPLIFRRKECKKAGRQASQIPPAGPPMGTRDGHTAMP